MNNKDSLGDRIKQYENVSRYFLTTRTPAIVRVDGRAFHSFTRGMAKPYDERLQLAMVTAAKEVAKDMQGFKVGYIQSDEASFVITDYDDINTQGWFNYNLSKMVSLAASIMSVHFNSAFVRLGGKLKKLQVFDARTFNIPENDIANYLLWRAKDWERNSLQMLARSNFSHRKLHKKRRSDMHEMLHEKGINWAADVEPKFRNGVFICRKEGKIAECYDVMAKYDHITDFLEKNVFNFGENC